MCKGVMYLVLSVRLSGAKPLLVMIQSKIHCSSSQHVQEYWAQSTPV